MRYNRWVTAGIAGGIGIFVANLVSQVLFFQLGEEILFHSDQQSDKLIAVMTQMEPLPVMETNPAVYMTISVFIGALHGGVFAYIRDSLPENTIKSGLAYGVILWVLRPSISSSMHPSICSVNRSHFWDWNCASGSSSSV